MSRFLQYLEMAWIVAAVCAFGVAVYNAVTFQKFDNHVYFPIFCGVFCLLIWYNIRGQRRFREKMFGKDDNKNRKP